MILVLTSKCTTSHTSNVHRPKYSFLCRLLHSFALNRSKMDVVNINHSWFCYCCACASFELALMSFYFQSEIKILGPSQFLVLK